MTTQRKLWIGLAALLAVSFTVLLWVGSEIHRVMPPIPSAVVTQDGWTIMTRADIVLKVHVPGRGATQPLD